MQSILDPRVLYTDISRDVVEHDVDVVSDLWTMDGRDVYRGSRDTQYSHANVYWLYTEELERTGLVEHSLTDHADFRILWFHDTPFGTLLQEEGWTSEYSVWSVLPQATVERFMAEDWTTPAKLLNACLYGDSRILTVDTVLSRPVVHGCEECGLKSLSTLKCGTQRSTLDIPDKTKILFIDDDLYVCEPPSSSRVWELLGFTSPKAEPRDDEPALPEPEQAPEQHLATPESPPAPAPRDPPQQSESPLQPAYPPQQPPPAQTSEPPSRAAGPTPERTRFATSRQTPGRTRRYSE